MLIRTLRRHWHRIVDCDQGEHDYQAHDINSTIVVKQRTLENQLGASLQALITHEAWCQWCGRPELLEPESELLWWEDWEN